MVSQGIKDILLGITFFKEHSFVMLLVGILILLLTGTLYKKLDK